ncbi:antitoxin [Streptodolium elevatio]|uniref:Antitoxin n=1 Tax=Streptodolium elevatio TaxID=3157996 RepID=A0ABV3DS59_9ACTN
MGLLDTIKEKLAPHGDKVGQGVDKAADMVDKKTGGKHGDKIDSAAEQAKGALGVPGEAQPPATPPATPEATPEAPPAGEAPPEQNPPA